MTIILDPLSAFLMTIDLFNFNLAKDSLSFFVRLWESLFLKFNSLKDLFTFVTKVLTAGSLILGVHVLGFLNLTNPGGIVRFRGGPSIASGLWKCSLSNSRLRNLFTSMWISARSASPGVGAKVMPFPKD